MLPLVVVVSARSASATFVSQNAAQCTSDRLGEAVPRHSGCLERQVWAGNVETAGVFAWGALGLTRPLNEALHCMHLWVLDWLAVVLPRVDHPRRLRGLHPRPRISAHAPVLLKRQRQIATAVVARIPEMSSPSRKRIADAMAEQTHSLAVALEMTIDIPKGDLMVMNRP